MNHITNDCNPNNEDRHIIIINRCVYSPAAAQQAFYAYHLINNLGDESHANVALMEECGVDTVAKFQDYFKHFVVNAIIAKAGESIESVINYIPEEDE